MLKTGNSADFSQATWRKSSHSSGNGECVELAASRSTIGVRDGKNPHAGHLTFSGRDFAALVAWLKRGEPTSRV